MEIKKAHFSFQDGNVNISVPFQKVDASTRTVSGFATLNNVDKHDDIVTQEASIKAFNSFRGNVREMHQPIAVGKVVEFTPETYYDGENDKFYSGIYVTAKVSTGAQSTWEKVLDGTLSGFSIGGKVIDAEVSWDDSLNKNIQIIKDMELFELSLVDNPANPLANVVSIQKNNNGQVDEITEHVYTCAQCKMVISSQADERVCPSCDNAMKDIGFMVAMGKNPDDVKKEIHKMLDAYETSITDEVVEKNDPLTEADTISEGDISMENNEMETVAEDTVVEEVVEKVADEESAPETTEDVSATDEIADAGVEEDSAEEASDEVVEEEVGEEEGQTDAFADITAALADLKSFVSDVLANHASDIKSAQEATAAVSKSVEAMKENFETAISEIKEVKDSVSHVAKAVDDLEDASAVQKSGSLGGEAEVVKKSIWGGTFLNVSDIENKEGR